MIHDSHSLNNDSPYRAGIPKGSVELRTDASVLAGEAGDLACEHYVLGKGKLQVEVLCNLEKIAPAGAVVMVSYHRIEGATGLPARVWAITE